MASPTDSHVEEAYRRYFPMILRKSERMLRGAGDAQDLAQETFLRLWQSREDLRDAGATTAWLYRTCTRLALDRIKSPARHVEASADLVESVASPIAAADERSHHRRLLDELFDTFPQYELEVAVLARGAPRAHPVEVVVAVIAPGLRMHAAEEKVAARTA